MKDFHSVLEKFNPNKTTGNTQPCQMQEIGVSSAEGISVNEMPVINGKTTPDVLSFIPANEAIIDGDMDGYIKTILNQVSAKLALAEDINDVADAFRQIDERIGKAEFVISVMISVIREEKRWKKFGYTSMNSFLDDLSGTCKMSRQTFTNAAQTGQVIRYLSGLLTKSALKLEINLTPAFFYRNYAKVKFLYRIMFVWRLSITNEILVNFRDMTFRNFEIYMRDFEEQNQAEIDRRKKSSAKASKKKDGKRRPKPKKGEPPKLCGNDQRIYREIRLGHSIGFVFNSTPAAWLGIYVVKAKRSTGGSMKDTSLIRKYSSGINRIYLCGIWTGQNYVQITRTLLFQDYLVFLWNYRQMK